jgi:hypothetical protein
MRISVLGNSDTTGRLLGPGERSWPELLREQLPVELHEPVEIDSWRFAPYRPDALTYALDLVDGARPDFVVVPLASYWCAYSTVQFSIENRFGGRAARLAARIEATYSRRFEQPGLHGAHRNTLVRRLARRVAGAGTLLTVEQFIDSYSMLIRDLSRREELQVIVLGDHHFDSAIRTTMPAIPAVIARIERAIRPVVAERRLTWGDLETAISAGGRRDEMLLSDGVHMTAEAHQRVAAALAPLLLRLAAAAV